MEEKTTEDIEKASVQFSGAHASFLFLSHRLTFSLADDQSFTGRSELYDPNAFGSSTKLGE